MKHVRCIILLLPLLMASLFEGYGLMVPVVLPSTELQMVLKAMIFGIPVAILIGFGRWTGDGTGTTLSGLLLFPLFWIYTQVLSQMFDPGFVATPLYGLNWNFFAGTAPFVLISGSMGWFASRKTNQSLFIAIALGVLSIVIIVGIH